MLACRRVLFTMAESPGVGPSAVSAFVRRSHACAHVRNRMHGLFIAIRTFSLLSFRQLLDWCFPRYCIMKLFDGFPSVTVLLLHQIQIQVREAVLSTLLALRAAFAAVDAVNEREASDTTAADFDKHKASLVSSTSLETLANAVLTPPLAPLLARLAGRSACANLVVEVVEHFGKQFGNVSADTSASAAGSSASTNSATAAIGNATMSEGATSSMSEESHEGSSVSSLSSSPSSSAKTWVGSAVDSARADALAAESKRRARAAAASAAISEERLALAVRLAPGSYSSIKSTQEPNYFFFFHFSFWF